MDELPRLDPRPPAVSRGHVRVQMGPLGVRADLSCMCAGIHGRFIAFNACSDMLHSWCAEYYVAASTTGLQQMRVDQVHIYDHAADMPLNVHYRMFAKAKRPRRPIDDADVLELRSESGHWRIPSEDEMGHREVHP
jgi:hypothetical protein